MNGNQNKPKKTIEVRTNICRNYDLVSSSYDYYALLLCKITKISLLLMVHLFDSCAPSPKRFESEYAVEYNFNPLM